MRPLPRQRPTRKAVLVTRSESDSGELRRELESVGLAVYELPVIAIAPPLDTFPLDQAAAQLDSYDWIAFTSRNAVRALTARADLVGRRVAAVGEATAHALRRLGVEPALVARGSGAAGLAAALTERGVAEKRILLPQGDLAGSELAEALAAAGALVTVVVAYRTVLPHVDHRALSPLREGQIGAVTLASPSAYLNLCGLLGDDTSCLDQVALVCIGPTTARAVRDSGRQPAAIAAQPSSRELARAALDALGATV